MNYIIKEGYIDDDVLVVDVSEFTNYQGKARLWVDGIGTNWFLVVGDYQADSPKPVRPQDTAHFNGELNRVFNQAKVGIANYGLAKRRAFNMDIHVSQGLLDAYTG